MKKMTAIISAAVLSLAACAPAFSGCAGDRVEFTLSEDGGKHYIVSCSGIGHAGEYEIPSYYGEGENYAPVTVIAEDGFASTKFSKIRIPETVTEIGAAAFSFCHSLKTVEFAGGISLKNFSYAMFGQCDNLQEIKIPDSVTELDRLVFYGCSSLSAVTMPSVEVIGARAFEECAALESITLPPTLTTIGTKAFYLAGLKSVEIPDSVHDIRTADGESETTVRGLGYASFEGCLNLESAKIGNGTEIISSGAFGYCRNLKEVYIPLSVKEIEGAYYEDGVFRCGHAFYGNSALTDIYYGGTEEQWSNIRIEIKSVYENGMTMDNGALTRAEKHFNS